MVNRYDQDLSRTTDAINRVSAPDAASRSNIVPNRTDEVIATLANSRENQRARQINEWESLRRRTFGADA